MTKSARMVIIDDNTSLFLYGFNKKNELIFRSTRNPSHLQNEMIIVKDGVCYTNLYFFSTSYLEGLTLIE